MTPQAHRQTRPRASKDGAARLPKEGARHRAAVLKHLRRAIVCIERALEHTKYDRPVPILAHDLVHQARFQIGEASAWLYQWQRWGGR